jgi:chromosome segregation ATPase
MTTITKYLSSWNVSDQAKVLCAESLPTIADIPIELAKDSDILIKKIWAIAKDMAEGELDAQREALKQAELDTHDKVEDAFKFSEAQALKIERLEDTLASMEAQLEENHTNYMLTTTQVNEAEKVNVGLSKDNEQLQNTINEPQFSLDSTVRANEKLTSDLKAKTSDWTDKIIGLEKLNVRFEMTAIELGEVKAELKTARKSVTESGKAISKLQGQLEIYAAFNKDHLHTDE